MKSLKQFETVKLHYNKYLYKLEICNILAPFFRSELQKNKTLNYIKVKLDQLNLCYSSGEPLTKTMYRSTVEVSRNEFLDAKDIYNILKNKKDYTIRIEGPVGLSIYTNDKEMLVRISNKLRDPAWGFWEPKLENISLLTQNVKIIAHPTMFNYQIHFKNPAQIDISFSNWLIANADKSRVGDKTLEAIQQGYVSGSYFYVRDEKILIIVQMLIGNTIQRIDKLVYIEG